MKGFWWELWAMGFDWAALMWAYAIVAGGFSAVVLGSLVAVAVFNWFGGAADESD